MASKKNPWELYQQYYQGSRDAGKTTSTQGAIKWRNYLNGTNRIEQVNAYGKTDDSLYAYAQRLDEERRKRQEQEMMSIDTDALRKEVDANGSSPFKRALGAWLNSAKKGVTMVSPVSAGEAWLLGKTKLGQNISGKVNDWLGDDKETAAKRAYLNQVEEFQRYKGYENTVAKMDELMEKDPNLRSQLDAYINAQPSEIDAGGNYVENSGTIYPSADWNPEPHIQDGTFDIAPATTYSARWDDARQRAMEPLLKKGLTEKEVLDYIDAKTRLDNRKTAQEKVQAHADNATSGFWQGAKESALSVPYNLTGGIGYLSNVADRMRGAPVDYYNPLNQPGQIAQGVRGAIAEEAGPVGGFLYQTGMSMVDSAAIQVLARAGVPPILATSLLGGSAAQSAMMDAHERGVSDDQAMWTGLAAGVAETLFEEVSLEKVLKLKGTDAASFGKRLLQRLRNMGIQGFTEGSEEVATTLANTITDHIINGGQSEYETNVRKYMEDGLSEQEARKKAQGQWILGLAADFGGGFLSGGVMGGVSTTLNTVRDNRYAKQSNRSDGGAALVNDVLAADPGNQMAKDARLKLDRGEKLSGNTLRLLEESRTTQAQGADTGRVQDAVAKELERRGVDAESAQVEASAIAKKWAADQVNPQRDAANMAHDERFELKPDERQALENSEHAEGILSDLRTTEQTDSNGWVEDVENRALKTGRQQMREINQARQQMTRAYLDSMDKHVLTAEDTAALEEQFGKAGAEAFVSMRPKGANDGVYYHAFNTAYLYGSTGVSLELAQEAVKGRLDAKAVEAAYAAGKGQAAFRAQQDSNTIRSRLTGVRNKAPGKVTMRVNTAGLTPTQWASVNAITTLSNVTGINVEVFESGTDAKGNFVGENGEYDPSTNTIKVDINAGRANVSDALAPVMMKTMGHELTHFIQHNNAEGYTELKKFVAQTLAEKGYNLESLARAKMDLSAKSGNPLTYEKAIDEVVADACEDMLQNTDAIDALARENWGVFKTIRNWIRSFHRALQRAFSADGYRHKEAEAMLDKAAELQKLWDDAFQRAVENYQQTADGRDAVEMTGKNGETVAVNDGNGHVQTSMRTYREGGREQLETYLEQRVKDNAITRQEADDMIAQMDEMYDLCQSFADQYALFGQWCEAEVRVDPKTGNPIFSVVKANGEYAMNLDFSLVCKKRRTLDAVFEQMISDGIMEDFDMVESSIAAINDIIRDNGFETACALCFVDSKRYRQGIVADAFVGMYNELVRSMIKDGQHADAFNFGGNSLIRNDGAGIDTLKDSDLDFTRINEVLKTEGKKTVLYKIAKDLKENAADRKLLIRGDFMSAKAFDTIKETNQRIMGLYNAKKGAGGPKASSLDVQYLSEILTNKKFNRAKAFSVGGVRIQSFSDYVPRLVFDYMQMIADLNAKDLPAHAYTKEPLFALQFGLSGIKTNMSLVPEVIKGGVAPGLDADGNYAWRDGQSFGSTVYGGSKAFIKKCYEIIGKKYNGQTRLTATEGFELAKAIQNADGYHQNCGIIAVGVSDEHIRKMLRDPDIRMVIPYHKSSLNHIVAVMTNIDQFTDYTGVQNTRKADGTKLSKGQKDFNYNEALQRLGDAKAAADEYLAWCDKKGYLPKFDQFRNEEGYYKLLEDFSCYDRDGYAAPQTGVKLALPTEDSAFGSMKDMIQMGLEEDTLLQGKQDKAVPEIVEQIKKTLPGIEAKQRVQMSERTFSDPNTGERVQYSMRADPELEKKNIETGNAAIDSLIEQAKTSDDPESLIVENAMYRTDIGYIDFRWGTPGRGNKFKGGYGLAHVISKRNAEGKNGVEISRKLVTALAKATIYDVQRNDQVDDGSYRIRLHYADTAVVLSKDPGENHWMLTGWENEKTAASASGEGYDSSAATAVTPTHTRRNGDATVSNNRVPQDEPGVKTQKSMRSVETYTTKADIDAEINRVQDQIRDIQNAQWHATEAAKRDPRVQEAQKRMWDAEDREGHVGSVRERMEYHRILKQVKEEFAAEIPEGDLNELAKRVQELKELREQFLKVTPITAAQYDKLVSHFGTTNDYGVVGFILQDGRMLDFSGKKQYGSAYAGGREVYHNEVGDVLNLPTDTSPRIDMVSNGNIRLVPEINGINLSQMPTEQQMDALRGFIEYHNGSIHVDIDNAAGRTVETFGYNKGTSASKILADIGNYFKTGTAPAAQSDLRQFYSLRAPTDISSRELLANALESVAQTAAERDILKNYQAKVEKLSDIQQKLNEQRALMRDHINGTHKLTTDEMMKARNRAKIYADQLDRADKALLKLEGMGPVKAMLDREHKAFRKAVEANERSQAQLARYNERMQKRIEDARQSMENYRQRRHETEDRRKYKGRINRIANDFRQMILHPTDTRYAPTDLMAGCYQVALMLDTSGEREDTKSKAKFREQMQRIENQYNALKDSRDSDYAMEYDQDFAYMVGQLRQRLDGKAIRDLSVAELEDVSNVLNDIYQMLRQAKYQIGKDEQVTNYSMGERIVRQQTEYNARQRNAGTRALAGVNRVAGNVMRNVRRMTDYDGDAAIAQLMDDINRGIRKKNRFAMEAEKLFDKFSGKRLRESNTKLNTYTLGGEEVQMTEQQAMQVILTWEREAVNGITRHMTGGGILLPNQAEMKKGRGTEAIRTGQNVYGITQEEVQGVYDTLDEWARDYMDTARDFFNGMAKDAINEATMQTKHRRMATTEAYIPFEIDSNTVAQEIEGVKFDATIEGMGMLKSVQEGAGNALIMRGLNTIVQRHIDKVGQVYGLAAPIKNFNKAMGVKMMGSSRVASAALNSADLKVLEDAVRDLQTPRQRARNVITNAMDKLQSAFVKATLLSNISVTIKQAASYSTAGLYLSQKALAPYQTTVAALFAANNSKMAKDLFAEIDEHTAAHYIRRKGMSLQEAATVAQDNGPVTRWMDEHIKADALNPLKWIQNMDVATTAALWLATKKQVELDGMTEADAGYWNKVTELYEKVIEDTQPNYDVLHRPEMQRTTDSLVKSILMFKTQPLQNAGIIWDAFGNYAAARRTGKSVAEARKTLTRAVGSQVASLAVFAAMSFLAYAAKNRLGRYKDDEEELTVESVMKVILKDMVSNSANLVMPVFGDAAFNAVDNVAKKARGETTYDVLSVPAVDMVNDWLKDVNSLVGHLSDLDSGKDKIPTDLRVVSMDVAALFGIPAENVYNIIRGTVGNVTDSIGMPLDWATDEEHTTKGMKAAWNNEHFDAAKEKLDALIAEKVANGKTEKEAKTALRSVMTTEFKPQYIAAYRKHDMDGMARIQQILSKCGLYDDLLKTLQSWIDKG